MEQIIPVMDSNMQHIENIIVGLGIAGVNLCHQLEKAGRSFVVIDRCPTNSSSLIAGGIYNPIALKRKIKSWKVDALFPVLTENYRELEVKLNSSFLLHPFPILKPIFSEHEITEWQQAVDDGRLLPYVDSVQKTAPKGPFQKNVIGSVTIKNSGFIRVEKLLLDYRKHLMQKELLINLAFEHSLLERDVTSVRYAGITADRIIYCEGRFISENPFFNWIPFKPTKGQMLTVKTDASLSPNQIYNQQFLLFPTEQEHVFRLGATYDWDNIDEIPTAEATEELLGKVEKALDIKLEVLEENAAVRPTVSDRRPVIGQHPEVNNAFLFNGMGTKGVMLAPYFAKQLVEHIYSGAPIDAEANLQRFMRKHYKKA
ncbi:NAD(P)/FAD-dependent oxidoreductase [Bacteroidota bacterium]